MFGYHLQYQNTPSKTEAAVSLAICRQYVRVDSTQLWIT